ncbi:MAG: hypothetical protein QG629_473 [Patescibacteria group bacterium]|nr:hypothetical protein [Candidatus Saccharibacteria bacterium]MDQ5963391.1 hypothetical protein [Patescibacteria group bacterium]
MAENLWQLSESYNFRYKGVNTEGINEIENWAITTDPITVPKQDEHIASRNSSYGISVDAGKLKVITRRHCIAQYTEPLNDTNVTTKVCPEGKITTYSSGRIESSKYYQGDIKVEGMILLPANPAAGTRQAFWLKNTQSYCGVTGGKTIQSSLLGELDILEWYGSQPEVGDATTYITCKMKGKEVVNPYSRHQTVSDTSYGGVWHKWSAKIHNNTVTYYLDNKEIPMTESSVLTQAVDTATTFTSKKEGITSARYTTSLNTGMQIRINGYTFGNLPGEVASAFDRPDPTIDFPAQIMEVKDVKIFTRLAKPSIVVSTPVQSAVLKAGSAIPITLDASSPRGIAKLKVYQVVGSKKTLIKAVKNPPSHSIVKWKPKLDPNQESQKMKVRIEMYEKGKAQPILSDPIAIRVLQKIPKPSISLTSDSVPGGERVVMRSESMAGVIKIDVVEWHGKTKKSTVKTFAKDGVAKFTWSSKGKKAGTYNLQANLFASYGGKVSSNKIEMRVKGGTKKSSKTSVLPSVMIVGLADTQEVALGKKVRVKVKSTTPAGLDRVELVSGGKILKVSRKNNINYSLSTAGVKIPRGASSKKIVIRAVVYAKDGRTARSQPVTIVVKKVE